MTDFLYVKNNYFTKSLIYKSSRINAIPFMNKIMCLLILMIMFIFGIYEYICKKNGGIEIIFIVFIMLFIMELINLLVARTKYNELSKDPYYYDLKFNLLDVEMIVEGNVVHKYVYNSFYAIKQTKSVYILFTKASNFIIIQKANLDAKQKEQFLRLVKEMELIKLSRIN